MKHWALIGLTLSGKGETKMSLGTDRAKIALEENGERKFLKNIEYEGEVSYDLTTEQDAELLTADQIAVAIKYLREAEPERNFFVVI